ncbi:calcyclin-binding protein [Thecamonas trahens ATCC 50062]|uniref:Calcyclin-binding protein n=1 Tax=Thecamonas trahens ATCC 50062 TaxID=461836 RepID=A0A0L0D3D1_THETB|nr:calcyclin-binding protein [Thecamonas trahens ATCC 50062]KNC46685.1 calcyclin-binding protein [Thecamonas trahens ATCC 50062]|eukprot:XP_013760453.1 calcyclin-binding protein [Thecamonas trahens ATCC 50062]
MSVVESLQADLAELERLLRQSERMAVRDVLEREMGLVRERLAQEMAASAAASDIANDAEAAQSVPMEVADDGDAVVWEAVNKLAWDQGGKNVTVYLSGLDGLDEVSEEQIEAKFRRDEVDVRVLGLAGGQRHVRLRFTPAEEITPSKCAVKRKAGGKMRIVLRKSETKHWVSLKAKSSGLGSLKPGKADAGEDPSAAIMNMMRKMYDEGDDTMKQAIGKAWTEARAKQGAGPAVE